jgi:hypothetical protein
MMDQSMVLLNAQVQFLVRSVFHIFWKCSCLYEGLSDFDSSVLFSRFRSLLISFKSSYINIGHFFSSCESPTLTSTDRDPLVQETKLAIVHIPLHLYSHFIQPILSLLTLANCTDEVDGLPRRKWAYPNAFTNISVTTIECSVVCPRHLVDELFRPLIERLDAKAKQAVIISNDDFVVIQVGGEGMEAGQRVLDLTAPLALAGM